MWENLQGDSGLLVLFISIVSLHIDIHVHWLWSSLWISFEIWSLLHCYFVTPSLVQQVFMQLLVGVHYWIHHCILYSLADAHVLFYCMWITLLYMYIYYQLAWLIRFYIKDSHFFSHQQSVSFLLASLIIIFLACLSCF